MENRKYLFGPVPSRRFGRSLGIDLTPYKTCSLDCVFCQLGRTTDKTIERREYVNIQEVLAELEEWLETDGVADYITLSGSGEPTLHERFGDVLALIREKSEIPSLLLTNGTLLHLPEVRKAAAQASIVKVSLSAWDQASFGWVNRPHAELRFEELISGQKAFRREYTGRLWMEVFLISGRNAMPGDVRKIAALAEEIGPDRIQLNTAIRPAAEDFAVPVSKERMMELTHLFHPPAEIIAEFSNQKDLKLGATKESVLAMLQRRPCTAGQIAEGFGMHLNEVSKYLGNLLSTDQIRTERKGETIYYAAAGRKG
ncbi:MAG: radical SAM protein [Deltaproteobacteria bacterium]|nr:radical SAM protein [Deltaproteobacteria bacterium]